MSRRTLFSVVAIALAVAVPVADAHTLTKATAKREAAKTGAKLAGQLDGLPATIYDCTRRSKHAFRCHIGIVTFDGAVCVSVVRVAYPNHDAETPTRRIVRGPDCEPPELLGLL